MHQNPALLPAEYIRKIVHFQTSMLAAYGLYRSVCRYRLGGEEGEEDELMHFEGPEEPNSEAINKFKGPEVPTADTITKVKGPEVPTAEIRGPGGTKS